MGGFEERRRAKRVPVDLRLDISSLFRQNHDLVKDVHAPIEVLDVSKTGIGFRTESILPIGYYFNAKLAIMNQDDAFFYCVVKIIREADNKDGTKTYGCEIIGFPSVLEYVFDDLEKNVE